MVLLHLISHVIFYVKLYKFSSRKNENVRKNYIGILFDSFLLDISFVVKSEARMII